MRPTAGLRPDAPGAFIAGLGGGLNQAFQNAQKMAEIQAQNDEKNNLSADRMAEIRARLDAMANQGDKNRASREKIAANRNETQKKLHGIGHGGVAKLTPQDQQFMSAYKQAHSEWSKYAGDIMNSQKDPTTMMTDFMQRNPAYGHLLFSQGPNGQWTDNTQNLDRFNSIITKGKSEPETAAPVAPVVPASPQMQGQGGGVIGNFVPGGAAPGGNL